MRAGYVIGFSDFTSQLPLSAVADELSRRVFAGVEFVEKDVDGDHDVGTLTLRSDFIGLQVDLIAEKGEYTLELGTRPSASVAGIEEVCDLSAMLDQRVRLIDDFDVSEPA